MMIDMATSVAVVIELARWLPYMSQWKKLPAELMAAWQRMQSPRHTPIIKNVNIRCSANVRVFSSLSFVIVFILPCYMLRFPY